MTYEEKEEQRKLLKAKLVEEYFDITGKIVRGEARMHQVYADRFASYNETRMNNELSQQIECMKGYRSHLMRRMAMLGIELDKIVS